MTNLNYANHLGEVESVDQYLRKLRCGIFNKECNHDAQVFFRGEKCCNWDLEPRLYRKYPRRNVAKMPNTRCCSQESCKTGLRSKEAEMLERLEMMEPEAFAEKPAPIDRLVMARHYGLPTRLLDVTTDPLVALYFASEESKGCECGACNGKIRVFVVNDDDEKTVKTANSDTVSMLAAFAMLNQCEQETLLKLCKKKLKCNPDAEITGKDWKDCPTKYHAVKRLQHFIAREKPFFEIRFKAIDFFRVVVVEPHRTFERLRAQSGAVMLSAFHTNFGDREVKEKWEQVGNSCELEVQRCNAPELWAPYEHRVMSLPNGRKCDIRKQLLRLNVNNYTVMTGLDAAASEVERWAKTPNA